MARLSVIIPARNERFLVPTIRDVLAKARGDLDILVCLDGYWTLSGETLPDDPRVHYLHRGDAVGMRDNINAAAAIATGDYLMKLDAHCMVAEGFDVTLVADCDDDWVMVPRRYALDAERWCIDESNPKYPVDYHYLSYPYERPGDPTCGLHGAEWRRRRDQRKHIEIDDEASSQGSCWFMAKALWDRIIVRMDTKLHGVFISEMQEIGMKAWLSGGALKVNKRTWYAHLRKGRAHGRGYSLGPNQFGQGPAVTDYYMNDRWPGRIPVRSMRWLVEHFAPMPTWPKDLDAAFAEARRRAA